MNDAAARKARPLYSGVLRYFPDALLEVAHCSYVGNLQHSPGKPLAWDKSKSTDEADALLRHLGDRARGEVYDTSGPEPVRHLAKVAWRALALLQRELEAARVAVPADPAAPVRPAAAPPDRDATPRHRAVADPSGDPYGAVS